MCLNSNYTVDDVAQLVTFTDSKYAFYGTTHDTKGEISEAKSLAQSFGLPEDKLFSLFETDFDSAPLKEIDDTRNVRDDAYIIYTSGTTAFPKAVLTSQYFMINIVLRMAEECKSVLGDKACVALHLFHAFGLGVPCMYLALGGTVYIPEKVKAQDIADIVQRESITDLWSVGAVYQSIIDSKEFTDKCAPFIRMCAIAGSYTSPVQFTRFEAALNHSTFLNMLGMTETASVFIMIRPEDSVMDDEGNVRIMGRIKDIIIKGGENITPTEIEAEAVNIHGVKECRVFGFKDRLYGENLGACVTLEAGANFDENAARKYLREKLGSFKVPAYFFIYDTFPLNATGKVDQRTLHTDMLKRLRKMELDNELEKGVCVLEVGIKNTSYAITPLAAMIEDYALEFGFRPKKASRIRLDCEEMLTERILNAFDDVGDIYLHCICFRNFMRITFEDSGQLYDFDKQRKKSESTKIISFVADDISITRKRDSNMTSYNLDFIYSSDFDATEFLASHERLI